jgi:hypothetical protein
MTVPKKPKARPMVSLRIPQLHRETSLRANYQSLKRPTGV